MTIKTASVPFSGHLDCSGLVMLMSVKSKFRSSLQVDRFCLHKQTLFRPAIHPHAAPHFGWLHETNPIPTSPRNLDSIPSHHPAICSIVRHLYQEHHILFLKGSDVCNQMAERRWLAIAIGGLVGLSSGPPYSRFTRPFLA